MASMTQRIVIVGGGVTGLAAAGFLADRADCMLLERESEVGGYCRTIYRDGFTWDYSGHFFHFKNEWVADRLHSRMRADEIHIITKIARIYFRGQYVDFPFQLNIDQLPKADFLRCLAEMYGVSQSRPAPYASFQDMVYARYGKSISEFFLIPYTEKLYATPASRLDPDAMGRFFPHVDFSMLISSMEKKVAQPTYNDTFAYHSRGAKAYVEALASYVPPDVVHTGIACEEIDLGRQVVHAGGRKYRYDRLIISAPLPEVLRMASVPYDPSAYTANKVLVLNLGFDRPSARPDHWVYYPEPEWVFYRVGHYDNILGQRQMSLYVEIAMPSEAPVDEEWYRMRALDDLRCCGVVLDHRLVSWSAVVMNPAYVHISRTSSEASRHARALLRDKNTYAIGRYGEWIYCSIEDNIVAASELARILDGEHSHREAT
jgi:protoporphyrinogen oxidase